ncbi:ABC transporter substrate-binding protein [Rhodobacteraceae bacterium NNCM2]|nr:ABC transporter substrate-binding protein [Coraliihabitans acroporae]
MIKKLLMPSLLAMALVGSAHADDQKIGALFPMSGPNAEYGDIFGSGANLAVKHINEDKMLSGNLTLVIEDSQALPAQGVNAMNKLVNVDGVPYTLTSFTGVSKAIAPIGDERQVVMVNGGGVGPDLATLGDYFWNVIPLANREMRALVPYALKEKGLKRVALVYVDDPLGDSILNVLEELVPENGGEIVGTHSIATTAQQFSGIAATLRSQDPEIIFVASYGAQQAQLVKQLRDNGIDQQFASYTAFSIPSMLNLPEAKGSLFTAQAIDRDSKDEVTERFYTDYQAEYGKEPNAYVVNYYNATRLYGLIAAALESDGKEITGPNLLAKRKEIGEFEFVGAHVVFNDDGTVSAPIEIREITDGGSNTIAVVTE